MLLDEIKVGDAVEVKVVSVPPVTLRDMTAPKRVASLYGTTVLWIPATVSMKWEAGICVVFSDHERLAISSDRLSHAIRRPINAES